MHEISIIRSVFNSLDEQFNLEERKRLIQIDMEVGLFSNIEPQLLQNAFKAVQEAENRFPRAKLRIDPIPIKIFCESCRMESVIENYKFVCQNCDRANNNLVSGTELLIKRVHFEEITNR